jgi:ABC-type polysaccharide/polyol phosphate export permease
MTKNIGSIDSIVRIIIGVVLIALVFVGPKTAWGWLGLIPLLTVVFRFCPAYALFKISTVGKNKA